MTAPAGIPAGGTWIGPWLVGTTYAVSDVVSYDNRYFIAHAVSTGNAPPLASSGQSSDAAWGVLQLPENPVRVDGVNDTPVNAVAATQSVTVEAGMPADGNTVTIDGVTYTYKTALSVGPAVPFEVLIGANVTAAALNLSRAITAGAGAGTLYGTGTTAHTTVTSSPAIGVVTLTASTKGADGNLFALTKVGANITLGGAVFAGGVDGTLSNGGYQGNDATYLYVAVAPNTKSDANWRRVSLGAVY